MKATTITTPTGEVVTAFARDEWQHAMAQKDKNNRIGSRNRVFTGSDQECHICGRRMSKKTANAIHIHMTVDGFIVPVATEMGHDSQGFFPVGNECAKMLPKTHRTLKGLK